MFNESLREAIKHYLFIKNKMSEQEAESSDINMFSGVDESLYDELYAAEQAFFNTISPQDFIDMREKLSAIRESIGELILENMVLKMEVRRLGGDINFLGNIDARGNA